MELGRCLNSKKEFSKDKDLTLNPQHTCLRKKSGTAVLTWNCSTGKWRQSLLASQPNWKHGFRGKRWRAIKEEPWGLILAFICVCKSIRAHILWEIEIKIVSSTRKINVLFKSLSNQTELPVLLWKERIWFSVVVAICCKEKFPWQGVRAIWVWQKCKVWLGIVFKKMMAIGFLLKKRMQPI